VVSVRRVSWGADIKGANNEPTGNPRRRITMKNKYTYYVAFRTQRELSFVIIDTEYFLDRKSDFVKWLNDFDKDHEEKTVPVFWKRLID
jgi:hypothetical protein